MQTVPDAFHKCFTHFVSAGPLYHKMALFVSQLSFTSDHCVPTESVADGNVDATRLSPPVTPSSETDVPFKAPDSDRTSLNMSKRPKYSRYHSNNTSHVRTYASHSKTKGSSSLASDTYDIRIVRSKSMPFVNPDSKPDSPHSTTAHHHGQEDALTLAGVRRWTLPSKTAPTKGLTTLLSCVKYERPAAPSSSCPKISPAMITLRRASLTPVSKTGLTFFPPPTFNRTRSGFMAQFLASLQGEGSQTSRALGYLCEEDRRNDRNRLPSIMVNSALPGGSTVASPMLTRVLTDVFHEDEPLNKLRRISTHHTSVGSTYEVIWDQSDSSTSASALSPTRSGESEHTEHVRHQENRRGSVAVDMLEAQLAKDIPRSRAGSQNVPQTQLSPRRQSFQSMINHSFAKFINDAALQNLPRSRHSNTPRLARQSNMYDSERPVSPSEDAAPLPALPETDNSDNYASARRRSSMPTRKSGVGSMLGISSHTRRSGSTAEDGQERRQGSNAGRRRKSSASKMKARGSSETETAPLLGDVR